MAFDIYGERLERGHCEVHPWVGEEYPCCLCVQAEREHKAQAAAYEQYCNEEAEAYYADQYAEYLLEGGVGCA